MYTEFYGLSHQPFQLTPDSRFFFESSVHRQAMAYLTYGLHHAEGFIVITGEVGTGKTMLVENLLSTISDSDFVIAKIVTTQVAGDDLLHMVAGGFGIARGSRPDLADHGEQAAAILGAHGGERLAAGIVEPAELVPQGDVAAVPPAGERRQVVRRDGDQRVARVRPR
jgi:hypothetical protein